MNSNTIRMAVLAIAFNTSLPVIGKEPSVLQYPVTRQVDQTDTYHGIEVADPYRWLEADVRNSKEVAAWTKAQNQVTRHYLDAISERPHISERLTKLWNYERYSVPSQKAGKYFYRKNSGLQNQAVLYIADNYTQEGRVLIDPNSWSEDGTISLGATWLSEEARYLAYSRRESGSDWSTIYVLETETGRLLQDKLLWTRWGNIVWSADSTGFYYTRYPEPEEGQQYQSQTINPMCYYHKLGTSQEEDQLVYRRKDQPEWSFWISRSEDDQYLVMSIRRGTDHQNQVLVRSVDAPKDSEWTPLIDDFENEFSYFGNQGKTLYFLTDLNAPTKRVITLDATKPGREYLTEIIASSEATLEDATLIDGKIITSYLKDVVSKISIHSQDGTFLHDVELPGVGSAHGFGGRQKDTETFYAFTSYATPTSIYRYDLKTGQSTQIRSPKVDFEPSQYTVRQAFYTSKDGTRVPIIVSHRKDLKLDGNRPTLLYGYGGFSISLSPYFSVEYATWMEMGGVVAIPNLRGGGEYGEAWHKAGKVLNKQNVFDDFIAATEWLIDERYTSSNKLAIRGGSNGGLLVGACMTQRPDLFGCCIPAVGVMDMLRFHKFTAGHFWQVEYGSSDNPEEFKALYAYSPYHNIKPETAYPATMVTTADTDDRVVPMHSFKFGAALQNASAGDAPILLRIESKSGHGAGTPTSKRIDAAADRLAFMWKSLGMSGD